MGGLCQSLRDPSARPRGTTSPRPIPGPCNSEPPGACTPRGLVLCPSHGAASVVPAAVGFGRAQKQGPGLVEISSAQDLDVLSGLFVCKQPQITQRAT